ncbi:MAG: peptidoglycan editing factor PgeF [Oscillospiraceae bacterium]|nr:peptidoglycan editing factor PgeF [Oscillospiraceae bacterium]
MEISRHLFTDRRGGVSRGAYASLNLRRSCDDPPENVRENFCRVGDMIGCQSFVFLSQQHTDRILHVDERDALQDVFDPLVEADGMVTRTPELALMVFAADCVPILLEGPGVVAAVHAGWRGTVKGIAAKAVREMECDPASVRAWIGPAIGPCCYQVGEEVREAMLECLGAEARAFFQEDRVDLKGFNRRLLEDSGVREVEVSPICTMCSHEEYWSHRYTGGVRGVQAGVIVLNGESKG